MWKDKKLNIYFVASTTECQVLLRATKMLLEIHVIKLFYSHKGIKGDLFELD